MGLKSKLAGLGAALALGLTLVGPAAATPAVPTGIGSVPVSVDVENNGTGALTLGFSTSAGASFGTVNTNAIGGTGGVTAAPGTTLQLELTGDDQLYRATSFDVTLGLMDSTSTGAYLGLSGTLPTFEGADQVDFQIPGRYMSITTLTNPTQTKWTGGVGSTCGAWSGGPAGCAPRDAAGTTAIYKVGDAPGIFGVYSATSTTCQVPNDSATHSWPTSGCPSNAFTSTAGIAVMHFRPGSGTDTTYQTVGLGLNVPAGVYPGTYTGNLIVQSVASN